MTSYWRVSADRQDSSDPMRPTLVARAMKRSIKPKADRNWWTVDGNSKLGDHYDFYDVHLRTENPDDWWCSCQATKGGEYRPTCSHITRAIIWRRDNTDPWADGEGLTRTVMGEGVEVDRQATETIAPSPSPTTDFSQLDFLEIKPSNPPVVSSPTDTVLSSPEIPAGADLAESAPADFYDPHDLYYEPEPEPSQLAWHGSDIDTALSSTRFPAFRPNQWQAMVDVVEEFNAGVKVVFLDAAPGNGKTLMAEGVRQVLGVKGAYTCTTKDLQDQIMRDFGHYAKVLKGKRNYPTADSPDEFPDINGGDCTMKRENLPACPGCAGFSSWGGDDEGNEGPHCNYCHPTRHCPYRIAKAVAAGARLSVLNTSYLLTEGNLGISAFAQWPLYIIDEADQLEKILLNYISVEIGPRTRTDLNIGLPEKKTVDDAWIDWVTFTVIPAIHAKLRESKVGQLTIGGVHDVKAARKRKTLEELLEKCRSLVATKTLDDGEEVIELESGWVLDGWDERKEESKTTVTFKPIKVNEYARKYLWDLGPRFLIMSGTFISPEQRAVDLGLEDGEWAVVSVPSSFPADRRPIQIRAEIEVTAKTKKDAHPVIAKQLSEIMRVHPHERILVHSVSYDLTSYLAYNTSDPHRRIVTYSNAYKRAEALATYLSREDSVMIAPSFDRGIDLKADDCRVIVIAKVPYPYIGDKQVAARLYGTGRAGRVWYAVETIATICQMTGRGMRSDEDWCRTYILDKSFLKLFYENRRLFPAWWTEALVLDENDPKWRDVLDNLGIDPAAPLDLEFEEDFYEETVVF